MAKEFNLVVPAGRDVGVCCAGEDARYSDSKVMIFPGAKTAAPFAAATNRRCLAVVEMAGEAPEKPTLLPCEAVKANGKDSMVKVTHEVRITSGKKTTVLEMPDQSGMYPCLNDLMTGAVDGEHDYRGILVDIDYLAQVAKAISPSGCLYLLIPKPKKEGESVCLPILAVGNPDDSGERSGPIGIGLIVPIGPSGGGGISVANIVEQAKSIVDELPTGAVHFGA